MTEKYQSENPSERGMTERSDMSLICDVPRLLFNAAVIPGYKRQFEHSVYFGHLHFHRNIGKCVHELCLVLRRPTYTAVGCSTGSHRGFH